VNAAGDTHQPQHHKSHGRSRLMFFIAVCNRLTYCTARNYAENEFRRISTISESH
jgi:hypothetical protein